MERLQARILHWKWAKLAWKYPPPPSPLTYNICLITKGLSFHPPLLTPPLSGSFIYFGRLFSFKTIGLSTTIFTGCCHANPNPNPNPNPNLSCCVDHLPATIQRILADECCLISCNAWHLTGSIRSILGIGGKERIVIARMPFENTRWYDTKRQDTKNRKNIVWKPSNQSTKYFTGWVCHDVYILALFL